VYRKFGSVSEAKFWYVGSQTNKFRLIWKVMAQKIKIALRSVLCVIGMALVWGDLAASSLRVNFPRRSTGARQDLLLVRYKPTQKALIVGAQGVLQLNSKVLESLGVAPAQQLDGSAFEFYRVYEPHRVSSMGVEERAQLRSWVNNPGGAQRLRLESMSIVRSSVLPQHVVELHLRPTYLILSKVALPQVSVAPKGEDPLLARKRRRAKSLRLLDSSWERLVEAKYDQSLLGFEALLKSGGESLSSEEIDKAVFGRGLSRFHQVGCSSASKDFEKLQRPGPYYADALYYGALCALDRGDTRLSKERFEKLMALNSERYAEQARFYVGVVYEQEGEISRAESAYLDTVDFANDESLVKLAKERLELLQDRKAREKYEKKIVSVLANVGFGYDSNVLSLPSGVEPADQGLKTGSSASYLALLYLDAKNPWLYPLQQRFQYSFLMLGYTDTVIASASDLQSHEMGANVEWGHEVNGKHKVSGTFALNFLGKVGSSSKYLTTYGARYDYTFAGLSPENALESLWMHSLSVQKQDLARAPSAPKFDSDAIDFNGSHRKKIFRGVESYGLGGLWQYKAAKGDEAKFLMLGPLAFYEKDLLWGKAKFKFIEEIAVKSSFYFASENSRRDYYLSSTTGLSHPIGANFDARAQLVLVKNLSNISDRYEYLRIQSNLSLSAFF
jgi:Tfp pilus assembly protein PilF